MPSTMNRGRGKIGGSTGPSSSKGPSKHKGNVKISNKIKSKEGRKGMNPMASAQRKFRDNKNRDKKQKRRREEDGEEDVLVQENKKVRTKFVQSSDEDEDEDELEQYERAPRRSLDADLKKKKNSGVLIPSASNGMNNKFSSIQELGEDDVEEEQVPEPEPEPEKEPLIHMISRSKKLFLETRTRVGELATVILSDPAKYVDQFNHLIAILDQRSDDPAYKLCFVRIQALVAITLTEVFKDTVPAYRIREKPIDKSTEGKDVRMKKEIFEHVKFEVTFLSHYTTFIHRLDRMLKCHKIDVRSSGGKSNRSTFYSAVKRYEDQDLLRLTASSCLGQLLLNHPYFNQRDTLIDLIVPMLTNRNDQIRNSVYQLICRLFQEDKLGQVSLKVVTAIGRLIKKVKMQVQPMVLRTFLSLRIREVKKRDIEGDIRKTREQMKKLSKKDKKYEKRMRGLKRELLEAEAAEDAEKKLSFHTDIMSQMFYIFFRFLQHFLSSEDNSIRSDDQDMDVMTAVFEGLSKFAHLINVDFFDDMISILYQLLMSNRLNNTQTLYCLNTVFTILSGDGSALNIDPQRFYSRLYVSLLNVDISNNLMDALHTTLDQMLVKRKRDLSLPRVLAFAKRFTSLSLTVPSPVAGSFLIRLKDMMNDHNKVDLLVDTDHFGASQFQPWLEDPEFAGAESTRLWDLHLLRRHFNPMVSSVAAQIVNSTKGKTHQLELITKTPDVIYHDILQEEFNFPGIRYPSHRKEGSSYRFIDSPHSMTSKLITIFE